MSAPTRTAAEYGKVAVLLGGKSAEREISLKSGQAVLEALKRQGVDAHAVDAKDNVIGQLQQGGFDRVFNMLHGRGGEDGVMQGALEVLGLPYTGSGVKASAIGMDKLRTKQIWQSMGLPIAPYVIIRAEQDLARVKDSLQYPVIVKPVHEGSSIGMARVDEEKDLKAAWLAAAAYDTEVMVEQWVHGMEYTAAILNDEALPLIRLQAANVFYDYDAKYISNSTQYHVPCGLDTETETRFQYLALQAFKAVNARGWSRVDMMVDEKQQPFLIEINTLPGMTDHSLVPMAAKARGLSFDELVLRILDSSFTDGQK